MTKKYLKSEAFKYFGTKQRNDRWGWSAIDDDGDVVALAIWEDLIQVSEGKPYYDGFDEFHQAALPNWIDKLGNKVRIEHIKHARAQLRDRVRIVILIAKDVNAKTREVESAYPKKDCWFKITYFNEKTGQVALEFSPSD